MRAVIQRVKSSAVEVEGEVISKIGKGLNILLGVQSGDEIEDAKYIAEKIVHLRIFEDENEKMNRSVKDVQGEILCISQFTLMGDCRKGRRPNFMAAAEPEFADQMYEKVIELMRAYDIHVYTGKFGAHMDVSIVNDGPVTVILDSKKNI